MFASFLLLLMFSYAPFYQLYLTRMIARLTQIYKGSKLIPASENIMIHMNVF